MRPAADPDARRQRRIALAVTVCLNVAFLALLRQLMIPLPVPPPPSAAAESILQVRLIDAPDVAPASPSLPVPAEPLPPPRTVPATRPASPPRDVTATSVPRADPPHPAPTIDLSSTTPAPSAATPALQLYDADGRIALPDSTPAPPAAFPLGPRPGASDLFAHKSPLPYAPTRFEKAWAAPVGETLGGELLRRATVSKTWRTPWGTEVRCSFVIVLGGCGWGFSPQDTIEEMQRVRADPPLPKTPHADPSAAPSSP